MRILEIIPVLDEGGAERFVTDLSNSLAKNHDVSLLVFYPTNLYGSFSNELKGVKLYSLDKTIGPSISCIFQLYRLILRIRPDVVHTHLNSIVYLFFSVLLYRKAIYIHTVHNDAEKEAGGFLNRLVRKILFKLRLVKAITISEESRLSFEKFYKMDAPMIYNGRPEYHLPDKLQTIENEVKALKFDEKSKVIINVARINAQKNQLALVNSINELNEQGFSVELIIIGPVNDCSIQRELKKIQTPYIHVIGVRDNPRDYMMFSDAFCLSSLYEGMPITLIEAFSVGTIPICTPVGGVKNMIEHMNNGILCSGVDKDSIKEGLIQFLNLTERQRQEMKINSKKAYSKFSMSTCCLKYENLIRQNLVMKKWKSKKF